MFAIHILLSMVLPAEPGVLFQEWSMSTWMLGLQELTTKTTAASRNFRGLSGPGQVATGDGDSHMAGHLAIEPSTAQQGLCEKTFTRCPRSVRFSTLKV